MCVGREEVMFEVSAAQLWSELFFFEAPPSVDGLAARKGSALFPEGDDLLNISIDPAAEIF
jgi:hypothetical protein